MTFQLLPAQESDVPDLVTIFHLAFADDPITGKLRRHVPMTIRRAEDTAKFSEFFGEKNICGAHVFKAVETETGYTVPFYISVFLWQDSFFSDGRKLLTLGLRR